VDPNHTNATALSEAKQRLLNAYIRNGAQARGVEQASRNELPSDKHQPVGSGRQTVRIRQLSLEDYPQVSALESKYGLGLKSYEQWSHVWFNNPAYKEVRDNWPIGWVLENQNKQIVGSHLNVPLLYRFRRQRLIAAQGRGLVVDVPYRGYSLWPLMAFWDQRSVSLCLDTTASPQADHDNRALGALRVPAGAWDQNVFWVTNYRGSVSVRLRRKIPAKLSFLVEPLSVPVAAALFLRDIVVAPALPRLETGLELDFQTGFDDRFDHFWEEVKNENPNLLLAVRTREVLEWHFAYALLQKNLWVWTITRGSHLTAYAIFLKTGAFGVTRVTLVDFQSLRRNAHLLLPTVSAALEKCRKEGVHLLENPGLGFDESGINRLAPYRVSTEAWSYFYKAGDSELAQRLSNPTAWAPSLYDGDASIL
jgi:hypothetical protein